MISIFNILNKTQAELLDFCETHLKQHGYEDTDVLKTQDFLFAQGDIPIMLVAHLDTVHKKLPEIYYDKQKRVLWSPDGIGGDDRCGVYALLKICETHKPYILFTTDEEVGGLGAGAFTEHFKGVQLQNDIDFIIEIDRRGYNEAVFYDCGNKDFEEYITSFGLTKAHGTFSDISVISPAFDIASVNLSAGYYNEHTTTEHIFLNDLNHTIDKVKEILDDTENHKKYDYQEVQHHYAYPKTVQTTYFNANEDIELPKFVITDFVTLTKGQWYKYYGFKKPNTLKELKKKYAEHFDDSYYDGWY